MASIDKDSVHDNIALDLDSGMAEEDAGQKHSVLLQAVVDYIPELKYCSIQGAGVVEFHSDVGATHQAAMVDCVCAKSDVVVGHRTAGEVRMRQPSLSETFFREPFSSHTKPEALIGIHLQQEQ